MMSWSPDRNQIQARVIRDSISPSKQRLTTIEVTLHRFVLAELNTHRVFSRNSASSRAIPVPKQIAKVRDHPAIPVAFGAEKKGMQAGEELTGHERDAAHGDWLEARHEALRLARRMHKRGVHKSIVNRILEPYLWHTVIITATEWDGFWHQRTHAAAQPEIREAAWRMFEEYQASIPEELAEGEWHTPYIRDTEDDGFWADLVMSGRVPEDMQDWPGIHKAALELRCRVSTARSARVSYLTHDGERDVQKDWELFDFLTKRTAWNADGTPKDPIHWSPLEHVATPCPGGNLQSPIGSMGQIVHLHRGNFVGYDQFRHIVEDRIKKEMA